MLDARFVADHLEEVRTRLAQRSGDFSAALSELDRLGAERRKLIAETEKLAAERNAANKDMAELAKSPDKTAFLARKEELKALSDKVKEKETELAALLAKFEECLLVVPNLPHPGAPVGKSETDNRLVRVWGTAPKFDFEPQAHWDLGEKLGVLDFERAAKLSGARFSVLTGGAARMERALISFMLDLHTGEHGYTEVAPPYLVRASALRGTGQLPKFEADLFKTARGGDDPEPLYLIPTAEVPLTNLHADEILEPGTLPVTYAAFTPCFRSEAGSYGKDVRGLIRQHQFDKVELVRFVEPERSYDELEKLTAHAEAVLQKLNLHYRTVELCTGDLGANSAKTYDLEVWLPSQNKFREISSCSNFEDFQARRAQIRYRPAVKEKPRLVHTLNGSGLAVGRTLVAIFEQYQNADGTITVPDALRPYMAGQERIVAR
jgi:seryl-tRNA synthetase